MPDGAPILLAEDTPTNQAIALNMLRRRGYRVELVANASEAVDAVRRDSYAAVLMDCQMPVLDGSAATAEIRRLEGDARRTAIIAMIAHAMEGDRGRCIAAGMDDDLSKPLGADTLDAVLQRWLGATQAAVVDRSVLRRLAPTSATEAIVDDICDLFPTTAGLRLEAIRAGDAETLRTEAHTLEGSAANVGAVLVSNVAAALEQLARATDLMAAEPWLSRLTDALGSTRATTAGRR